jgi:hypothetical protein
MLRLQVPRQPLHAARLRLLPPVPLLQQVLQPRLVGAVRPQKLLSKLLMESSQRSSENWGRPPKVQVQALEFRGG